MKKTIPIIIMLLLATVATAQLNRPRAAIYVTGNIADRDELKMLLEEHIINIGEHSPVDVPTIDAVARSQTGNAASLTDEEIAHLSKDIDASLRFVYVMEYVDGRLRYREIDVEEAVARILREVEVAEENIAEAFGAVFEEEEIVDTLAVETVAEIETELETETFIDNIEMVRVEGGTFRMKRRGRVTLNSYYIGKFEVTQAQWVAVMGSSPSYFMDPSRPVENVSWNDVQGFINRLNQFTGRTGNRAYRLPTEDEWEFAARGGNSSGGFKYSGSNNIDDVAWYRKNSGEMAHPVGTKAPNELGIYDMSGNVWEWVYDRSRRGMGSYRVFRGGSWYYDAKRCRVSYSGSNTPDLRSASLGFRLAVSSP